MALHEIHWNPHTRAMVLVRNHGSGPDNGCGWDGEEVRDVEDLSKKDRVKLAGNAVTPPVMTAIAERIMAALREAA
jgi:site-specific DNA-cytosine methylase